MSMIDLEQAARAHHAAGGRWSDFWNRHADEIRAAVKCYDRDGFHKLYSKLLSLVVAGDTDGQRAVGDDEPWLIDERASEATPHDTITSAKLQPGAIDQ